MNTFAQMLCDLESNRLSVELVPAREPKHACHFVRVACGVNPLWYRNLCAAYASRRKGYRGGKFKTKIKRRGILAALERLAAGTYSKSNYVADLDKIAANYENAANFAKTSKANTLRLFAIS